MKLKDLKLAFLMVFLSGCAAPRQQLNLPYQRMMPADEVTRLHIFLDRSGFGPGKLDGQRGEFTEKALARFARSRGLKVNSPDQIERQLPLRQINPIYTFYRITPADAARVGSLSEKVEDQAKQRGLPYTSLLEFVAERYHSDRAFIRAINPGKNLNQLRVGDTVRVPNVAPLQVETLRQNGYLIPANPALSNRHVEVSLHARMLEVFEGQRLIAAFPITPGSSSIPAPRGNWKIVVMASMPYFRHDEKMLNEGIQSTNFHQLPPGPNSPVGVMWMGLNRRGIGLHGTNNPETIGRAASHGCIRLANWDAVKLSRLVSVGTPVIIR
ncbi:MAG: L,D-transpeptidase family protein [Verrucomicrobiia bacterium]